MESLNRSHTNVARNDPTSSSTRDAFHLSNILDATKALNLPHRPSTPGPASGKNKKQLIPRNSLFHQRSSHTKAPMNAAAKQVEVIDLISDDDDDDIFVTAPERPQLNTPSSSSSGAPSPVKMEAAPLEQRNASQVQPYVPVQPLVQPFPPAQPQPPINPPNPQQNDAIDQFMADAGAPPQPIANQDVWGDYILDEAWDDEALNEVLMQQLSEAPEGNFQVPPPPRPAPPPGFDQPQPPQEQPRPQEESQEACVDTVLVIFPDICRDHVAGLYDEVAHNSDQIIDHILENGGSYPKAKDRQKTLKRKRDAVVVDEDTAAAAKYGAADRASPVMKLRAHIKEALSSDFPDTPKVFIDATLTQSNYRLFPAYRVLEEASRTFDPAHPPYNKIKTARKKSPQFLEYLVQVYIDNPTNDAEMKEMMKELQAARRMRKKAEEKRAEERQKEIEEEENYVKAEAEGTLSECGCCFSDYPLNRMIHCNGDTLHWFCRGCARQTAEVEIGNSKYELHCMSMEGCTAGFSNEQRSLFLDEKTIIALERNEQEAMLRMAGIENLESCPFCPFAAEYPPVELNKEFTCQSPDCEIVSCRLCKLVSHIPKTCEEFAKENGLSVRRQIEEAMSAALIRKCNKCGTPFVKEEGCNKMTCTRNGCLNVQCYVCSKSCGYDHFNDKTRGGKEGNCPLFESVEARHEEEVKKAEREALERVRAEHPEYTEEDLMVKVSEDVKKDEQLRKARTDPAARLLQAHGHRMRIADIIPRVGRRPGRAAAKAEALQDAIRGEAEADEVLNGLFPGVQPANAQNAFNDYMAMHNAPQDLRDQIDYPVPLQLPKLGEPGPPVANPNNGNPLPNLGQLNVQLEIPALRPDPMDLFQGPPQLGAQRINRTRNPVAVARGDQVNEARGDALEIETQAALQSNTPPDALRQLDAVMADLAALPQRRLSLHKPVAQKLEGYYDKNREGSSAAALGQKKEDSRRKRKESDKIAREMGARAHDAGRLDVFENPPGFIYGSLGNASVLPRRRAARPHEDVRRNIVRRLENVTITPQANRNAQPDAPEVAPGQIPQLCHSVKALDILPTSPQEERDALKAFVELMMRADGRDKGLKLIDFGLMLQHVYDSILDENEERIQTAASAALNPSVEREYLAREQHQARMDALLILRQQDAARLQIAPVQSAGDLLKNGNQDFEKKMKELRERTAAWNNAAAAAGNSERGGDPMKGIEGPRMPTQDIGSPLPLPTIARKGMQGKLEPNPPSAQPVRASRTPNAPAVLPALSPNPVQANLQAQRTFLEDQLARTSDGPLAQNIRQNLVAINELLTTRDQAQQRRREAVLQAPPALRFAPIRPGRHHATLQQKQAESGRIDELDKKPAAMQGWQRQPRPRNHQIVPLVHEAPAPRQVPTNRRKTDKVNKTLLDYRNEQLHLMGQAQAALRNGSRGADVKLGGFLPRIGSALPIAQAQASASAPNTIPVQQHSAARSLQDMADEPMEDPNNIVDREDGILGWKNERAKK